MSVTHAKISTHAFFFWLTSRTSLMPKSYEPMLPMPSTQKLDPRTYAPTPPTNPHHQRDLADPVSAVSDLQQGIMLSTSFGLRTLDF